MTTTTTHCTFTRNNRTGQFDVIGPADVIHDGATVIVHKKDGSTTTVTISRATKPFVGKFGPLQGQQCRMGTVAQSHRRSSGRKSGYCYYPCPVTGRKCCPENGPCHDCL